VGCENASQLNREYSRPCGQSPMRDIRALRWPGGAAAGIGREPAERGMSCGGRVD